MLRLLTILCLVLPAISYPEEVEYRHNSGAGANCPACHNTTTGGLYRHIGTDNNGCAYCHQFGNGDSGISDIRVPENSDCIRCHCNSEAYRVNPEHETLTCSTCHRPHGSDMDQLLRVTTNTLCTENCHGLEQLGRSHPRGSGSIDTHTGDELTCTSTCHSIHTTNPEHLLTISPPQLCAGCHTGKL